MVNKREMMEPTPNPIDLDDVGKNSAICNIVTKKVIVIKLLQRTKTKISTQESSSEKRIISIKKEL